jgi:hypothetical protein
MMLFLTHRDRSASQMFFSCIDTKIVHKNSRVHVRMLMTGDPMTVECRSDSLVSHLKHKVCDQNSTLVVRRQRLMLLSDEDGLDFQVLANSHTLASYGIVNGTTLQLVMAEKLLPFVQVQPLSSRGWRASFLLILKMTFTNCISTSPTS